MFWTFLLAHLIADYPLQTDKMVVAKQRWQGLLKHTAVHFAVLVVLSLTELGVLLPYILVLSVGHYGIDAFKNWLRRRFPTWVIWSYIQDQVLHFLSIGFVAYAGRDLAVADLPVAWVLFAVGFLLVTHVTFVTERVVFYQDKRLVAWLNAGIWQGLIIRGGLYCLGFLPAPFSWLLYLAGIIYVNRFWQKYPNRKALPFIEVGVVVLVVFLVRLFLVLSSV